MAEIQKSIDEVDTENRKHGPPQDGGANRGTLMIDAPRALLYEHRWHALLPSSRRHAVQRGECVETRRTVGVKFFLG
jgi:hypothetical protein